MYVAPSCSWWRAIWHRHLRRYDRQFFWTPLRQQASRRHPDDEEAAVLVALKGWAVFLAQPGQAHWHCGCAAQDDADPGRTL